MLTYGRLTESYTIKREEQTDAAIISRFYAVQAKVDKMDEDAADAFTESVGIVTMPFGYTADEIVAAKALVKSYKVTLKDAEIWYCHEED